MAKTTKNPLHHLYLRITRKVPIYGWRYIWDSKYRKRCQNREKKIRDRAIYGSGYLANRRYRRNRLLERDGGNCQYCYTPLRLEVEGDTTIDHIVPASQGGHSGLTNLRLLHKHCHVELHRLQEM